ncbi:cytochrome-c peroxidase [Chitinophaga sp. Cy-1792]|uniref:cytochrome-c peroxidase n=1 Tax=Chitinophaga sp. Cy-1792 TaxID=2608339 RepID=UPI001F041C11|nr:cytochrome c peroxidase [Chitinophaga sp. Cy-1792]
MTFSVSGIHLSHAPIVLKDTTYTYIYPSYFSNRINTPPDNPATVNGVYLGRMLFYEKLLSGTNTISCASCHQQSKAFTDGKQFSTGIDTVTTTRNSMSLANLLWVRNFFWDGRAASLEAQAATPLTAPHEMGQPLAISVHKLSQTRHYPTLFKAAFGTATITDTLIIKALAQFERSLISANSNYDKYLVHQYTPTTAEANGMALFMGNPAPEKGIRGAGCGHCHGGPKLFVELYHNNGLDSFPADEGRASITGQPTDIGRFRTVTLRNIALTAPYMHDGRFATLEEVLDHYSDHIKQSSTLSPAIRGNYNDTLTHTLHLSEKEKNDIIAFLHMLTDSTFIHDKRFSDPHL